MRRNSNVLLWTINLQRSRPADILPSFNFSRPKNSIGRKKENEKDNKKSKKSKKSLSSPVRPSGFRGMHNIFINLFSKQTNQQQKCAHRAANVQFQHKAFQTCPQGHYCTVETVGGASPGFTHGTLPTTQQATTAARVVLIHFEPKGAARSHNVWQTPYESVSRLSRTLRYEVAK